jgi:hypothetical protein
VVAASVYSSLYNLALIDDDVSLGT